MEMELADLDLECLKSTRTDYIRRVTDLGLEDETKNKAAIQKLRGLIKKIQEEINSRVEKQGKSEVLSLVGAKASNYVSIELKNMSHTILNGVPMFSSGQDVHIWISKLETYYKLYVAKDETGVMEGHFVKNTLSRICPEYLSPMMAEGVKMESFEDIKNYLKQNHASKLSNFQILDTVWEEDKKDHETLRDFAIRLDEKAMEAKKIIMAKFEEWKKSMNPSSNASMGVDDLMKLVSGQVFLQYLKTRNQVVYNSICNDLDKTWNATEISLKAMTYSDRLVNEDSPNQGVVPSAFPAKYKGTRRSSDKKCWDFMEKGECHRENCRYVHDQDAYEKQNDEENAKKKGKKPKAYVAYGHGSQEDMDERTRRAAMMPMPFNTVTVPLPTQDFRN